MRLPFPAAFLIAACSVAPAQPSAHRLSWSAETIVGTPRLIRAPTDASGDTGFVRPSSIRANTRAVVVGDVGDDRVVVLDTIGAIQRRIGSRGRGPAELLGVSHLALRDSSILIGDAYNGRVSEFAFDGRFMGAFTAGFAAGAIGANNHEVFAASRSGDFYATRLTHDDSPSDAFRRPAFKRSSASERWTRLVGHDLLATDSIRTWVFDQTHGALCAYANADSPAQCLQFPEQVLQRLQRYRTERVDRLERAIRMRVEAAPLAKDLILAGRYLALLVPLPDMPVLLIDPADATLTPLRIIGNPLPDWVRSARSFAWDGHAFLLVGDDGLGRLNVTTLSSIER